MYHDVVTGGDLDVSGFSGAGPAHYKLDRAAFAEHLDRVADAMRRPPVPVGSLAGGAQADGSWSITFDDGGASATDIAEELDRRSWRGDFFIVTDRIGERGFLSADAIRALDAAGHGIGSHSRTHPRRLGSRPVPEILDEWRSSADALSSLLGHPVTTASVPGGWYSRDVARAAATAGLQVLCTSEPVRRVSRVDGCMVVGRGAIERDTPAATAVGFATGETRVWLSAWAAWNARKVAKTLAGGRYEQVRAALLARR